MNEQEQENIICKIVCIATGLIAGAVLWYLLRDWVGPVFSVILAFFAFFGVAWFLHGHFCKESQITVVNTDGDVMAEVIAADSEVTQNDASDKPAMVAPDKQAVTRSKVQSVKSRTAASRTPAKKSASRKTSASKEASGKVAGPERLKKPKGKADNLKMISGVGPKIEQKLNSLGFWHFEQIAKWKKADMMIVDEELSFKGRIERDDWIKQAKALAKGGEAEYIKVFGKKPR